MGLEVKQNIKNEILILSRKPEIYSSRRLVEVLTLRNRSFRFEDPETADIGTPFVILPRLGTWRFFETISRLKNIASPVRFINGLDPYVRSRNKWSCLQQLAKENIPAPSSQLVHRDEFSYLELPYPFVLKDIFSSQGLGVYLVQSPEDLQKVLAERPQTEDFLVQEYIAEAHGKDLRIFLTSQGKHWSIQRENSSGDFRSNLNVGGKASLAEASNMELEMAFAALKSFGLDYAGVDILRSHEGPLMIEVNPCPGFQGLESVHGKVAAESIIDLIK
jgi:ribosomal protein S6--L-glutamate ligase